MCKYFFIISLFLTHFVGNCQLSDDFSDGDLSSNPSWSGNVENFIVNDDLELQLNAPNAGESFIFTDIAPGETNEWNFNFRMEFSPSSGNALRIYFSLSDQDISVANGYYLEVGETGSDDELKFFTLESGNPTLLGSGMMGAVSADPAQANVKIVKSPDMWQVDVNYNGGAILTPEITIPDVNSISNTSYFGIWCVYTSTRTDKFFFDNIYSGPEIIDNEGPQLSSSSLQNSSSILLCFDESVAELSPSDILISPIVEISSVEYFQGELNKLLVSFSQEITGGIDYSLDIPLLTDLAGNTSSIESIMFSRLATPAIGDLVINEILSDPFPNGPDFVEIFNRSENTLSISGLLLANSDNGNIEAIEGPESIAPGDYMAFTEDKDFLEANYILQNPDAVYEIDLPSYNNNDGNVSLLYDDGVNTITIDSFDYFDDLHYVLLDDTEGVSLERLSSEIDANTEDNWNSASELSGFATPGYQNSNRIIPTVTTDIFHLDKKVFSPDGDGFEDLLIVNYALPKAGFLLSINIYDAEGKFIRNLAESTLPSVNGIVQWDGTDKDGEITSMGIYVAHFSGIHPDGDIVDDKLVFAVAQVLD